MRNMIVLDKEEYLRLVDISSISPAMNDPVGIVSKRGANILFVGNRLGMSSFSTNAATRHVAQPLPLALSILCDDGFV